MQELMVETTQNKIMRLKRKGIKVNKVKQRSIITDYEPVVV